MREFLLKWNYKKQLVAELITYGSISAIVNTLLWKKRPVKKKLTSPKSVATQMPKKQKIFNMVLFGVFAADLTASFFLLKHLKKKLG